MRFRQRQSRGRGSACRRVERQTGAGWLGSSLLITGSATAGLFLRRPGTHPRRFLVGVKWEALCKRIGSREEDAKDGVGFCRLRLSLEPDELSRNNADYQSPDGGPNMFLFGYVFELNKAVDSLDCLMQAYTKYIYLRCHRPRRATPAR